MAVRANLGTQNLSQYWESIEHPMHPCVVLPMKAKAGQGVLEKGLIVGKDANGEIVPYDPAATDANGNPLPEATPVGVLAEEIDTGKDTIAKVIVHGTVFKERLKKASGTVNATDLEKLQALTIYAI